MLCVALSVSRANSGWPAATRSPSFASHSTRRTSPPDAPTSGTMTREITSPSGRGAAPVTGVESTTATAGLPPASYLGLGFATEKVDENLLGQQQAVAGRTHAGAKGLLAEGRPRDIFVEGADALEHFVAGQQAGDRQPLHRLGGAGAV